MTDATFDLTQKYYAMLIVFLGSCGPFFALPADQRANAIRALNLDLGVYASDHLLSAKQIQETTQELAMVESQLGWEQLGVEARQMLEKEQEEQKKQEEQEIVFAFRMKKWQMDEEYSDYVEDAKRAVRRWAKKVEMVDCAFGILSEDEDEERFQLLKDYAAEPCRRSSSHFNSVPIPKSRLDDYKEKLAEKKRGRQYSEREEMLDRNVKRVRKE